MTSSVVSLFTWFPRHDGALDFQLTKTNSYVSIPWTLNTLIVSTHYIYYLHKFDRVSLSSINYSSLRSTSLPSSAMTPPLRPVIIIHLMRSTMVQPSLFNHFNNSLTSTALIHRHRTLLRAAPRSNPTRNRVLLHLPRPHAHNPPLQLTKTP